MLWWTSSLAAAAEPMALSTLQVRIAAVAAAAEVGRALA